MVLMMTSQAAEQPAGTVRVRVKKGARLMIGRTEFGQPIMAPPGEWIDLPAVDLQSKDVLDLILTEEQVEQGDTDAGAPRVAAQPDQNFDRGSSMFRQRAESAASELEASKEVQAQQQRADEEAGAALDGEEPRTRAGRAARAKRGE